ncbi:ABC transporter ATP-binding protein [Planomicrobium sp. CPCC 101079]|uniref:ABC transporter ATP-binding protein n=1 Tax=Planomicrobium sp. CPCC 101079 TaxID=2599618 RepID=UPI0011B78168|nr:ABC transporter ATP-binding protein [Planomicrobium sp. CPCC 101079]TWT01595.1 ABC transporter ATP-binding protein [Planomicrobium sp. CPCC 101079]
MEKQPLLEVKDLKTNFYTENGVVTAVDGISFTVEEGEIVGVVGESGCGKSVTSQSILRLFDEEYTAQYEGAISFKGENLLKKPLSTMHDLRGNEISMIFQDPSSALNPVYTIGKQVAESMRLHRNVSKKEAHEKAIKLLEMMGIPSPEKRANEYPHQLSGGMLQRAMIAMALACEPDLLIADEPTTALDVTIQAQILDLMVRLNKEMGMAMMFITHDLGVVAQICDRVVVMYLGQIVEEADVKTLFSNPVHPYTKGLIQSIPQVDGLRPEKLHVIKGTVPTLNNVPTGCRFAERCAFSDSRCFQQAPELEAHTEGHKVRCWNAHEIAKKEVNAYEAINL